MNELLFLFHAFATAFCASIALIIGKEALIAFVSMSCILANLFVVKQISFFGWSATASDAFAIGSVLGLNLLNEYFGKQTAMKALGASFFTCICYAVFSKIHLAYTPHAFDHCHAHFQALLTTTPRIIAASLTAYGISQFFETQLYALLKIVTGGSFFIIRNCITMPLAQLLDTIIFSYLGLFGIVHNIYHVMIISYVVKLLAIASSTPCLWLIKRIKSS